MNYDKVGARLWNEITAALVELPKERFRTKLRSFISGLLLYERSVIITATLVELPKERFRTKLRSFISGLLLYERSVI